MHLSMPGHWLADDTLAPLEASELLMLNQMLWRAARRSGRLDAVRLYQDHGIGGLAQEIDSLAEWSMFELAQRIFVAHPDVAFLTHLGTKGDAYWDRTRQGS